jgi:hypothetical protein
MQCASAAVDVVLQSGGQHAIVTSPFSPHLHLGLGVHACVCAGTCHTTPCILSRLFASPGVHVCVCMRGCTTSPLLVLPAFPLCGGTRASRGFVDFRQQWMCVVMGSLTPISAAPPPFITVPHPSSNRLPRGLRAWRRQCIHESRSDVFVLCYLLHILALYLLDARCAVYTHTHFLFLFHVMLFLTVHALGSPSSFLCVYPTNDLGNSPYKRFWETHSPHNFRTPDNLWPDSITNTGSPPYHACDLHYWDFKDLIDVPYTLYFWPYLEELGKRVRTQITDQS